MTVASTRSYSVMGGVLRSELEFPELTTTECQQANWTLQVVHSPPPPASCRPLGQRQLGREFYQLARTDSGFRLEYSHAGWFDISSDGASIVWYPGPDAHAELARSIVLGPAMAIALETAGFLCLHGSAVCWGDEAIAFVGPKDYGKSTLARALSAAGGCLISDDILAMRPGPPARVRPGVTGLESAAGGSAAAQAAVPDCRLMALYLLDTVPAGTASFACRRQSHTGTDAAVSLAHQTKLANPLIGYSAAGAQLKLAVAVALHVPVWTLSVVRDLSRLPEVAGQIARWHQTASVAR